MPDRFELVERLAEARAERRATPRRSSAASSACRRSRRATRCSARAASASASSTPRSTRCRCARSSAPRARSASAATRRRGWRSWSRSSPTPRELELCRALIERVAAEEGFPRDGFEIGSMIELPRACLRAGELAASAEFFSFGTNDLTQTAIGFSRDDIEAQDRAALRRRRHPRALAVRDDRRSSASASSSASRSSAAGPRVPSIELGICGEHGGDPGSIRFFHSAGLDYVSCSPYRVPIARVAAAQAAIDSRE